MDKASLLSYRKRWKLLEDVQRDERANMTMEEKYDSMVSIHHLARSIGRPPMRDEESERLTWDRWSTLRKRYYEASRS